MDSASLSFVLYGLLAAWVMSWSASAAWRSNVLLCASALFLYLVGATLNNFLPLAGFLILGYAGTRLAAKHKHLLQAFVIGTVLAFAYLKKYTFIPDKTFIEHPYFTLGLSYVFFRVLHVMIDWREMAPVDRPGPLRYLSYTLNFTTLISGPIQRYPEFRAYISEAPDARLDMRTIVSQLARIAVGYFKVNVAASVLDLIQINAFLSVSHPGPSSAHFLAVLTLIVVYPFFLYNNFSGYIDIVIALARLMKRRLPENFDRPFSASSFLDFWNRWHITLSQWLKFYVYNPLLIALMRRVSSVTVQPYLGVLCFFITFFLIGVWHGRTSEFTVFGLLQGGGVAINKLWQMFLGKRLGRKRYKSLSADARYVAFGRGLTFSWFAFTMFWFWGNWNQLQIVLSSLSVSYWITVWLIVVLAASIVLTASVLLEERFLRSVGDAHAGALPTFVRPVLLGGVLFASFFYCALLDQPAPGIIYKTF